MLIAAAKYAELARIDLTYAKVELESYRDDQNNIRRALEHLAEAEFHLKRLVPEFDMGHAQANTEAA